MEIKICLPFNFEPGYKSAIHVEDLEDFLAVKEDDKHVIDSDESVTQSQTSSLCWSVSSAVVLVP